ncbi:MAG TPA: TetR/AcrR family transcriptional regulator [Kofleriaceae bacterium]|nr:TetR/AcrR family transcriptional regulator [Kofleriaceae bacterium]
MKSKPTRAQSAPEELLFDSGARRFTQDRARRTYEALVTAAAEAFIAGGYDATGTPDIAAHAGVSVGTFYRYFDDKKQIYVEVARRHLAEAYRQTVSRLAPTQFVGKGRHDTIQATVDALIEVASKHPGMNKVFVEMTLRDPDVAALNRAFEDMGRRRLADLISAITPRGVVPDPEATAYVLQIAAVETANALAGVHGAPAIPAARAKAALTELIHRALFGLEP